MSKLRLDKLLVDQGLAASRERAQALILAGRVLVDEQRVDKPGTAVDAAASLRLLGEDLRYVSRGGLKLEGALQQWAIRLEGRACADIGASTGGFTDCMLQHGAASVLAVDTGYGQIAQKLRSDTRVTLLERTNARLLTPGQLASLHATSVAESVATKQPPISEASAPIPSPISAPISSQLSFFAMDVSFISATLVLPAVLAALASAGERWQGEAVVLVKPQFEAGREWVGKGGIVRDPAAHTLALDRVRGCIEALGGRVLAQSDSPILGMEGNREFLYHARF